MNVLRLELKCTTH